MPFRSQAQRRFMYARHPEMAKEWEEATPKGKKLPEKVKHSFELGVVDALARFGLKQASEELRLKIPSRTFHGYDAAHKNEAENAGKKANDASADDLAKLLAEVQSPRSPTMVDSTRDRLDRSTAWGAPSNLAAGDTAGRLSDMGQNTGFGGI